MIPIIHSPCRHAVVLLISVATGAFAQVAPPNDSDAVRVNLTLNGDGSRTAFQFDTANHKATATTTEPDGKPRGKIVYTIDEQGRFSRSESFDAKGRFRFKSLYKYDAAGRITEETQLGGDDAVLNKIVYSYDANGRQTGYSVFDGSGKLLGQTNAPNLQQLPATAPAQKPRKK